MVSVIYIHIALAAYLVIVITLIAMAPLLWRVIVEECTTGPLARGCFISLNQWYKCGKTIQMQQDVCNYHRQQWTVAYYSKRDSYIKFTSRQRGEVTSHDNFCPLKFGTIWYMQKDAYNYGGSYMKCFAIIPALLPLRCFTIPVFLAAILFFRRVFTYIESPVGWQYS